MHRIRWALLAADGGTRLKAFNAAGQSVLPESQQL